jgi:chromosome segregation ATPase
MGDSEDIWRLQRRLDAMEVEIGRLTARDGELAAELAIVRQEAADLRSRCEFQEQVAGSLQERLAALETGFSALKAELQTERHYRQTGTLPQKAPVGRARTPSDDMRGIR